MSMNEYRKIYEKLIVKKSEGIIFSYDPLHDQYEYQPYSHLTGTAGIKSLAKLMRNNLPFYCYGESEIVQEYARGRLDDLEKCARYAYIQRLPKRQGTSDGLLSEVLFDLLIEIFEPQATKLALRTIFRQNDNNEIKGYDLTYLSKSGDNTISLWLGQAKMGDYRYCISSIHDDLLSKYTTSYFTKQIYFLCDKPYATSNESKYLLGIVDDLNRSMIDAPADQRERELVKLFERKDISIKIPCLLAYENELLYDNPANLYLNLCNEIEKVRLFYSKKNYSSLVLKPHIMFMVFPLSSIEQIRDEEGFYNGLR